MKELVNVQIYTNEEGINVVSSRVIAEELGKEHKNVLRDLDKIFDSSNVSHQFIKSEYENRGKMYREYLLTKDGFILYVMNIQGYNDFKMAYINKFNEMERQLKEQQAQINQKDRLLLDLFSDEPSVVANAHKQLVELEKAPLIKQLEEQKPKVEFAETICNSDDCIDVSTFSKILQSNGFDLGRNKLFKWLRDNKYLNKKNEPYQRYITHGIFRTIEVAKGGRIFPKTIITSKGQEYLLKKLKSSFKIENIEIDLNLLSVSNVKIDV